MIYFITNENTRFYINYTNKYYQVLSLIQGILFEKHVISSTSTELLIITSSLDQYTIQPSHTILCVYWKYKLIQQLNTQSSVYKVYHFTHTHTHTHTVTHTHTHTHRRCTLTISVSTNSWFIFTICKKSHFFELCVTDYRSYTIPIDAAWSVLE